MHGIHQTYGRPQWTAAAQQESVGQPPAQRLQALAQRLGTRARGIIVVPRQRSSIQKIELQIGKTPGVDGGLYHFAGISQRFRAR
jgi:hypothetical protein